MAKKLGAPIALGVITVLAILLITGTGNEDKEILKSTFLIEAVYFDENSDEHIEITFRD